MSKYGIYLVLLYLMAFVIVISNIERSVSNTIEYEYINNNSVKVDISLREYNFISNNDCILAYVYNDIKYEIHSQILSKSYHNKSVVLTLQDLSRYNHIGESKKGTIQIQNINKNIGNIIWDGIINSLNF
ncbi:MAG: hypothetical protein RR555_08265 [Bacteroidales bacterium]